ncbi:MAG: rhomboid family intramembrane serine protease [Planctomycetes bacterium]|nr:rhomboid family intramembrane serine protease [Planctomycetota bacterium]
MPNVATGANQPVGDLQRVVGWLVLLWAVFIADVVMHVFFAQPALGERFGLRPHTVSGLVGIVGAPFLHANIQHLVGNTVPLFILGWLSCGYSRKLTLVAVVYAALIGGTLTWFLGSSNEVHIGASGIVFGLAGFLLANAIFRKGCGAILIALLVIVLFGSSLYAGLVIREAGGQRISLEMHAGGLLGGVIAAWRLRRQKA